MRLLFLILMTSLTAPLVGSANESCGERLRAIVKGEKQPLRITRRLYSLAQPALQHYREELRGEAPYIESAARYVSDDAVFLGYKISITDGGDESLVDYFLDGQGSLISAYWHNQSPQRFWFCDHN